MLGGRGEGVTLGWTRRNRRHFPCFYQVIATWEKVSENKKKLIRKRPFPHPNKQIMTLCWGQVEQKYREGMKMFTLTSLQYYYLYRLQWSMGKAYWCIASYRGIMNEKVGLRNTTSWPNKIRKLYLVSSSFMLGKTLGVLATITWWVKETNTNLKRTSTIRNITQKIHRLRLRVLAILIDSKFWKNLTLLHVIWKGDMC